MGKAFRGFDFDCFKVWFCGCFGRKFYDLVFGSAICFESESPSAIMRRKEGDKLWIITWDNNKMNQTAKFTIITKK